MNDEDILAELRVWRDEFAREHGYDLVRMATVLRELDSAAGGRIVRGEPRCPAVILPPGASTPNQPLRPTAAP